MANVRKNPLRLHLEIQTSRKSPVGILRSSFYADGQTKHEQYGRIVGKTLEELKTLQLAFRGSVTPVGSADEMKILLSKEYGASKAIYSVIKTLELDRVLSPTFAAWVNPCLSMIAGRILYAGSKLSLCRQQRNSNLWEICGVHSNVDVDKHCYEAMDELLDNQASIMRKLSKKHIQNGQLVLYDITSSYLEGEYEKSDLVEFGYNRDGKKGHEQIVIGLICAEGGCPVAVEVFPGNTKDSTTVMQIVKQVKNDYAINDIVFVGDRGMTTKQNILGIQKEEGLRLITALTRVSLRDLIDSQLIQMSLFDEKDICEVTDPSDPNKRYVICRNAKKAKEDQDTLDVLLQKASEGLEEIKKYKRATTVEILGARVGKILNKYHTSKYITWRVDADSTQTTQTTQTTLNTSKHHKLIWEFNAAAIEQSKKLAGCYCITANVDPKDMSAKEIVGAYKSLIHVEQAFRSLKTVHLEMRPIYHKKDDRIKAHVFLCMLSYYVQWHMQQLLKPLFDKDSKKDSKKDSTKDSWTFDSVIDTLKQITKNTCEINGAEVIKITNPTLEQKEILTLLGVKL